MRAVVFDRFGPPDVLRITELPDPTPGAGELRVLVRAAGVQPFDVGVRRGWIAPRPMVFPQQIGQEYAGIVDIGTPELPAGTPVLGSTMLNGQATHVVVPAAQVVRKPPELDFPT